MATRSVSESRFSLSSIHYNSKVAITTTQNAGLLRRGWVLACIWLAVQATPSIPVFLSGFAFFLGLYLVVFVIAKQLILSLASVTLDNAVDVNGLQVGMIPAEQIVRVEQPDGTVRYEKKQVEFSSGQDDNIVISPDPIRSD